MQNRRKQFIVLGVLVVLALVALFLALARSNREPAPSGPGYYTGPMKGKGAAATLGGEE